ncbi:MAG: hypothetical protein WCK76_03590 [Elusimicrobiota bacterium]
MENYDENKKTGTGEEEYADLEEVPEPFRAAMKARLDAAKSAAAAPGAAQPATEKDFQFPLQGGSGLGLLLKLLVQTAQQQAGGAPDSPDTGEETLFPVQKPAAPEPVAPGAIEPTSNGWVLWAAVIILAAVYFLTKYRTMIITAFS